MENNTPRKEEQDVLFGRNAVTEALSSGRPIEHLLVEQGSNGYGKLISRCRERGIPVKEVSQKKLEGMYGGTGHQGIALVCAVKDYASVEDILKIAQEKGEPPFIVIADEIMDPHNLGAIIRSAYALGAHGIIIPKRRSAGLTSTVYKTSAGALSHIPVARVSNLVSCLEELKKKNIWCYCADMDGQSYCSVNFSGGVALIIGSEGEGVGRLIREHCDITVSLPMANQYDSLNASVAAGILMQEIYRQRLGLKALNPKE